SDVRLHLTQRIKTHSGRASRSWTRSATTATTSAARTNRGFYFLDCRQVAVQFFFLMLAQFGFQAVDCRVVQINDGLARLGACTCASTGTAREKDIEGSLWT